MKATIIGTGKVGSALAFALKKAGHRINALVNHDVRVAARIGRGTGCRSVYGKVVRDSVEGSDIIFISVEDSHIKQVVSELNKLQIPGKTIILHTSGVYTSAELKIRSARKENLGSFHPIQTLPVISFKDQKLLEKIYFGIEGGKNALKAIKKLVTGFKSEYLLIPGKAKAEYHLSCVLASNFVISNFYLHGLLSKALGVSEKKLFESQKPLLMNTIENIGKYGAVKSLTGPVSRGDHETVIKHLNVLHRKYPGFIEYYKSVSAVLLKAAKKKDRKLDSKKLIKLLGE